jgi:hypothetical protein
MPNDYLTWEAIMVSAAALAAISFLGIVAAIGWIAYVSAGIKHADKRGLRAANGALGTPLGRADKHALRATGARWI